MAPILVELYKRFPFFGLGLGLGLLGSSSGSSSSSSSSSTNSGSSSSSSSSSTKRSSRSHGLVYNGTNSTNSSSGRSSTGGASYSTSLDWIPLLILGVVLGLPILLSVCFVVYNCWYELKKKRKRKREELSPMEPVPPVELGPMEPVRPVELAAKVVDEAVPSYNSSQRLIYNPPAYPPNTYQG